MKDKNGKKMRYVREIQSYKMFGVWCDYCRTWTMDPEKHRHEDPLY